MNISGGKRGDSGRNSGPYVGKEIIDGNSI